MKDTFKAPLLRFAWNLIVNLLSLATFCCLVAGSAVTSVGVFNLAFRPGWERKEVLLFSLGGVLMGVMAVLLAILLGKMLRSPVFFPSSLLTAVRVTDKDVTLFLFPNDTVRIMKSCLRISASTQGLWLNWQEDGRDKIILINKGVFTAKTIASFSEYFPEQP